MSTTRCNGRAMSSASAPALPNGAISAWSIQGSTIDKLTAHTMLFGFQLIQPGEVAPAHRHTMTAFRFVLQGKGAFTNVDGEKMLMQPGDLIRTPQWAWHEHENQGSEAMIWADGLDVPLIETLQVVSVERRHEERLRVKEGTIHPSLYGMMRPAGQAAQQLVAPLHYRWSDTYAALQRLAEKVADPYDGVALDYVDPLTGGPTFPTLLCRIQMFRPGEQTQSHRHRSTSIYHVFRGSGTTQVDGKTLAWEQGGQFRRAAMELAQPCESTSGDLDKSKKFYGEVVGLKISDELPGLDDRSRPADQWRRLDHV